MIAADRPRLAIPTSQLRPATTVPSTTLFGRLGSLLTRALLAAAEHTSDEGVWTSVARGL